MNQEPIKLTPSYFAPKKHERPMFNDWPIWPPKDDEDEREKLAAKLGRDEDQAIENWREENEEAGQ